MSITLFLLNGSNVAQRLARQCGLSSRDGMTGPNLLVRWVSEPEMREVAWESHGDAPVPEVVLESVAGETGAVLQEFDATLVRSMVADLIKGSTVSYALRGPGGAAGYAGRAVGPDSAGGVQALLFWLPAWRVVFGVLGAAFFAGFLLGSYTALRASDLSGVEVRRRQIDGAGLSREHRRTGNRLEEIERELADVSRAVRQLLDSQSR